MHYRVKTGASWGGWTLYSGAITITDEASHDVEFYATDTAGNDSAHLTRYYNLDKTAPTASETTSYLTTSASAWQSVNLRPGAVLAGTDALSGPASVHYRMKTGAGAFGSWTLYAAPITLSDEATHEIEFYATDNAGNDGAHLTRYYNLDKTAPTATESTSYLQTSSTAWTNLDLAAPNGPALLAGSDGLSGLAGFQYRVKTAATWGSWTAYAGGITITSQGSARRRVLRDRQRR